jgi:hypothetical protein
LAARVVSYFVAEAASFRSAISLDFMLTADTGAAIFS